jgi:hypothetical protein
LIPFQKSQEKSVNFVSWFSFCDPHNFKALVQ